MFGLYTSTHLLCITSSHMVLLCTLNTRKTIYTKVALGCILSSHVHPWCIPLHCAHCSLLNASLTPQTTQQLLQMCSKYVPIFDIKITSYSLLHLYTPLHTIEERGWRTRVKRSKASTLRMEFATQPNSHCIFINQIKD